jgi:TolA-binding protein
MRILLIIPLIIFAISCEEVQNSNTDGTGEAKEQTAASVFEELENLHKELLYEDGATNGLKAADLYAQSIQFLNSFPNDSLRMVVMEYARAAATGSGRLKNADVILKMMIDEFPNHPLRPEKMSLRAFTLWQLGDITASTKIYNQIMKDYPESEWARDAEGSLRMNQLNTDGGALPDYFERPQ